MNKDKPNFGSALFLIALLMLIIASGFFFQKEDDNLITGNMVGITGMVAAKPTTYQPFNVISSGGTADSTPLRVANNGNTKVLQSYSTVSGWTNVPSNRGSVNSDGTVSYYGRTEINQLDASSISPTYSTHSAEIFAPEGATSYSYDPDTQKTTYFRTASTGGLEQYVPENLVSNPAIVWQRSQTLASLTSLLSTSSSTRPVTGGTSALSPAPTTFSIGNRVQNSEGYSGTVTGLDSVGDPIVRFDNNKIDAVPMVSSSLVRLQDVTIETSTPNSVGENHPDWNAYWHQETLEYNIYDAQGNFKGTSISLGAFDLVTQQTVTLGQPLQLNDGTVIPLGTDIIQRSDGSIQLKDGTGTIVPSGDWQQLFQLTAPANTEIVDDEHTYYVNSQNNIVQKADPFVWYDPRTWLNIFSEDTVISPNDPNYETLGSQLNQRAQTNQDSAGYLQTFAGPDGKLYYVSESDITITPSRLTQESLDSALQAGEVKSGIGPTVHISQNQDGTLFYSVGNQQTQVQYTDSSGSNYRTYVDSNGNVYASTGWISWFDKKIGHQNADGTVTLNSNIGGTVNMPATTIQKASSVPAGTSYDGDSWLAYFNLGPGYTATSTFFDPATGSITQSQSGTASNQVYIRNGEYYTRTDTPTGTQFVPANLGDSTTRVTQRGTSAWGDNLYAYNGANYYIGSDGKTVYKNEWGRDSLATGDASYAVHLAAANANKLNEISSRSTVRVPSGSGGAASTYTLSTEGGSVSKVYNSQGQEVTNEAERQKVIDTYTEQQNKQFSDVLFSLTMKLLEDYLKDYKQEIVSDMCKSDWGSSQSTGGTTPVTVADTPIPSVNNESNFSMYCLGLNDTTGTAQYVISDQYTFYTYYYSWTLQACKQDIIYSVYFNPGRYPRESGTLNYDHAPAAVTTNFDKIELYNEICIETDDSDFGNGGTACFPANSTPPARQTTINFTDECESLGTFSLNNSYDIYFAGNDYQDLTSISQDVSIAASLTSATSPFSTQYNSGKLNFYLVNKVFEDASMVDIRNYAITHCDYTHPAARFTVILNPNKLDCEQSGYIVELNPTFAFKPEIADASMSDMINDFCTYVEFLNYTNPPQVFMVTQSMQVNPGMIPIEFQIYDEEYPVNYELLFNNITIVNSSVKNSSVKNHTLNIPSGFWNLQIKATDKRGNVAYSNITQIFATELIDVYFGEDPIVDLPIGSSWNLDLNSFAEDPRGNPFVGWIHYPIFSDCIDFEPEGTSMSDGNIKLIGTQICQENVTFEVIGTGNRRGKASILVNVID